MWAYIVFLSSFPVECPDVYIVERLFSSSLVVVVSLSMPRRMNVYHFKKGTEICNYSYSNNILSVRLNRQVRKKEMDCSVPVILRVVAYMLVLWPLRLSPPQRLVVCLEESIYIHNIKDMKLLKTLLNTPTNPSGTHKLLYIHLYLDHINSMYIDSYRLWPKIYQLHATFAKSAHVLNIIVNATPYKYWPFPPAWFCFSSDTWFWTVQSISTKK